jgi:hypothetical protein
VPVKQPLHGGPVGWFGHGHAADEFSCFGHAVRLFTFLLMQWAHVGNAVLNVGTKHVPIVWFCWVFVRAPAIREQVEDAAAEREDVDLAGRPTAPVHLGRVEPERADLTSRSVHGGGGE